MNRFSSKHIKKNALTKAILLAPFSLLPGCGSSDSSSTSASSLEPNPKTFTVQVGTDLNTQDHPLLNENPEGPGGSPNQSLRADDILVGDQFDNVLIGGLSIDVLLGKAETIF